MYIVDLMGGRLPLFDPTFLATRWSAEYTAFRNSKAEVDLLARLRNWAERVERSERVDESAFVETFFKKTWGYIGNGEGLRADGFTCHPQYPVPGAGAGGGTGAADIALGWWERDGVSSVPQVLGEFKDVTSNLEAPQRRKGSTRSPVEQCGDYLREAGRAARFGAVEPTWGFVSDMNEFRLYSRATMPHEVQRFVIARRHGADESVVLLDDGEEARLHRFLFRRVFARESLLTTDARPSELAQLVREQGVHERVIEKDFYREYHAYREAVFRALVEKNPDFHGTRGKLVRLAQRFLDRCLFVMFCEDMGARLNFPQHLLRNLLIRESLDPTYDPEATDIWAKVKRLFVAMRDGTAFGRDTINRFNGGCSTTSPTSTRSSSRTACSAPAIRAPARLAGRTTSGPRSTSRRSTTSASRATGRGPSASTPSAASSSSRSPTSSSWSRRRTGARRSRSCRSGSATASTTRPRSSPGSSSSTRSARAWPSFGASTA